MCISLQISAQFFSHSSSIFLPKIVLNWSICLATLFIGLLNLQVMLLFGLLTPINWIRKSNLNYFRAGMVVAHFLLCGLTYMWNAAYVDSDDPARTVIWIRYLGFLCWSFAIIFCSASEGFLLIHYIKKHLLAISKGNEISFIQTQSRILINQLIMMLVFSISGSLVYIVGNTLFDETNPDTAAYFVITIQISTALYSWYAIFIGFLFEKLIFLQTHRVSVSRVGSRKKSGLFTQSLSVSRRQTNSNIASILSK